MLSTIYSRNKILRDMVTEQEKQEMQDVMQKIANAIYNSAASESDSEE